MELTTSLTGQFLVAMPSLGDPNFFQSVTIICEHSGKGSIGIIVNQPSDMNTREFLQHMQLTAETGLHMENRIHSGGPVQVNHGFVLHEPHGEWESTLRIDEHIGVTTSHDILAAIAKGRGPERILITLGYAGWGAGQLEQEIAANAWLTVPSDLDILFSLPADQRWRASAAKLGVDVTLLAGDAGHA